MAQNNGKPTAKFVIKPFRPYNQMDQGQAEEIWSQLRAAIQQIHKKNASTLSFEELYRNAYNLVLHKHGELLYNGVCECVRSNLSEVAADVATTADEVLLGRLNRAWTEHQQTMMMVRDILMYMDRTYVTSQRKVAIYDHGLIIFRDTIARHPQVKDRLKALLLDSVRRERNGQLVERILVK
jgi:cullin 3